MGAQEDAVFSVLNDWLDLPQDLFFRLWPELQRAFEFGESDPGDNYTGPTYMEFDD